jgi:hypothetical protein
MSNTKPLSSQIEYDGGTAQDVLDSAKPLASYTALRAYNGRATSARITARGIGGFFVRDAADVVSADDGGTVIVDALGRRWKRLFDGSYHVKWFGAAADGATDDSVPIRLAIAATPNGARLNFGSGTYLLTQDGANVWCIRFTKPVFVECDGSVELKANNNTRTVLRFEAAVISDAPMVVNGNNKTNIAVEVNSTGAGSALKYWEGKNVTQQFDTSIQAAVFRTASAVNVVFENCYAHDATSSANGAESDNYGAARGFLFDGAAATFGVNKVIGCRVANIVNDRGIAGDYEDEDGIVTQMTNSRLICENNFIWNCMKRGIKCQNPATVTGNVVLSSRTLGSGSGVIDGLKGMYGGISVYSDDCKVERNMVASTSCFDGVTGGSFAYGIEVGDTAVRYRNSINENTLRIGVNSNARAREIISIKGAQVALRVCGNKVDIAAGLTLSNTYGLRIEGDHATTRATVNIEDNDFSYLTYAMYLRGGFSGTIRGNKIRNLQGPWGIAVDTHALTLSPQSVVIACNEGLGFASNYVVRVNDTGVVGLTLDGNISDSATLPPCFVAAGMPYVEIGSNGVSRPMNIWGSAPPTVGTFAQGAICNATTPGPAAPVTQWRCTAAGTPGTWRQVSHIVGGGATASRPALTAADGGVMYFDTTLDPDGKPIWWVGTYWVDATGTPV